MSDVHPEAAPEETAEAFPRQLDLGVVYFLKKTVAILAREYIIVC